MRTGGFVALRRVSTVLRHPGSDRPGVGPAAGKARPARRPRRVFESLVLPPPESDDIGAILALIAAQEAS